MTDEEAAADAAPVVGLLLAAGAGRRMGTPKGLLRSGDGTPWVVRAARTLLAGGCGEVVVVVGARADDVAALVASVPGVRTVVAEDWAEGMGASLRAGLGALTEDTRPDPAADPAASARRPLAVVVGLVDTLGVTPPVVARLVAAAVEAGPSGLSRAAFDGLPGHPVVLGRDHWRGVRDAARGDAGARGYLAGRAVRLVECADVGEGADADTPANAPGTRGLSTLGP